MNWVAIASVVQAFAAVVIVAFTIVSLRTSHRMAGATAEQVGATIGMTEQIRHATLPVLTLEVVDIAFAGAAVERPDGFEVLITNVGLGPALEVALEVELLGAEPLVWTHRLWQGSAIGAGARIGALDVRVDAARLRRAVLDASAAAIVAITVGYEDIYGRAGGLHGSVKYAAEVPQGNNHARFEATAFQVPGLAPRPPASASSAAA